MRSLLGPGQSGEVDLAAAYAAPPGPWLRVNMVSTVDGAATGESGTSGAINNAADKAVFDTLRSQADVVLVGAGTARAEEYGPADCPVVLVSRSGDVPVGLRGAEPGRVLLATYAGSPGLTEARELLGADSVLVCGEDAVDLVALRALLVERGWEQILAEGGPGLLRDLLAQQVVDELDLTWVPRLVAGEHPRITAGAGVDVALDLHRLVEHDGTLFGRWMVKR